MKASELPLGSKPLKLRTSKRFPGLPQTVDLPPDLKNYSRRQLFAYAAIAASCRAISSAATRGEASGVVGKRLTYPAQCDNQQEK